MVEIKDSADGWGEVGDDWLSASTLRPFVLEDPCLVWLDRFGEDSGFSRDSGPYDFVRWIGAQSRLFEGRWLREYLADAPKVLEEDISRRDRERWDEVLDRLRFGLPALAYVPLWESEDGLFGVADAVVQTECLYRIFPHLRPEEPEPPHYAILDLKFSRKVDSPQKRGSFRILEAQVRLLSHILSKVQGFAPPRAFVVTRDRIENPLPIRTKLAEGLPGDLARIRDDYRHILTKGRDLKPWIDPIVRPNFRNDQDAPWQGAKRRIGDEFWPRRPLEWLPRIGAAQKKRLQDLGYRGLDDVLAEDPERLPLAELPSIGTFVPALSAIIQANREGRPTSVIGDVLPPRHHHEFFVDFEFFTNVKCDFEGDWPALQGMPMCFLIGVGYEVRGRWRFQTFAAEREDKESERRLFAEFYSFLRGQGALAKGARTALYHWSPAEVRQTRMAAEEHDMTHLNRLPWIDLHDCFSRGPVGLPGCFDYSLKSVARAISKVSPAHAVEWPDEMGSGQAAMVAGWQAYAEDAPAESEAMKLVRKYLEIDVKAMWQALRWLRTSVVVQPALFSEEDVDPASSR